MLFLRGAFDYETANGQRRPKRKPHYDRTGDKEIEISEGTAIFFPVIEAEFNVDDPNPDDTGKKITTEAECATLQEETSMKEVQWEPLLRRVMGLRLK